MTWRHVDEDTIPGLATFCDFEVRRDIDPATWWMEPCGCTTPTTDPASPCGFKSGGPLDIPCGATGSDDWHKRSFWWQEPWLYHPHLPTRCTCGHPIEPVR